MRKEKIILPQDIYKELKYIQEGYFMDKELEPMDCFKNSIDSLKNEVLEENLEELLNYKNVCRVFEINRNIFTNDRFKNLTKDKIIIEVANILEKEIRDNIEKIEKYYAIYKVKLPIHFIQKLRKTINENLLTPNEKLKPILKELLNPSELSEIYNINIGIIDNFNINSTLNLKEKLRILQSKLIKDFIENKEDMDKYETVIASMDIEYEY